MSNFTEDDIKRAGLPADVFGLLHDLCYHVNNNLRGNLDEIAVHNYVRRAQVILKGKQTMVLDKKWTEFCESNFIHPQRVSQVKEIFYAGAQAGIDTIPIPPEAESHEIQGEIDVFRGSLKVSQ